MKLVTPLAALALATVTFSGPAEAAVPRLPDMSGDEVAALAVYAVPSLLTATRQTCAGRLSPDGFLARHGDLLAQRYAAEQNAAWPAARSALFKFAGAKAGDKLKDFATLARQRHPTAGRCLDPARGRRKDPPRTRAATSSAWQPRSPRLSRRMRGAFWA